MFSCITLPESFATRVKRLALGVGGLVYALNAQSEPQALLMFDLGVQKSAEQSGSLAQGSPQIRVPIPMSVQTKTLVSESLTYSESQNEDRLSRPSTQTDLKSPGFAEYVQVVKVEAEGGVEGGYTSSASNVKLQVNLTPEVILQNVPEQVLSKSRPPEVEQGAGAVKSLVNFNIAIDGPDVVAESTQDSTPITPAELTFEMPSDRMLAQVQAVGLTPETISNFTPNSDPVASIVEMPVQATQTNITITELDIEPTLESLATVGVSPTQTLVEVTNNTVSNNLAVDNTVANTAPFELLVEIQPGLIEELPGQVGQVTLSESRPELGSEFRAKPNQAQSASVQVLPVVEKPLPQAVSIDAVTMDVLALEDGAEDKFGDETGVSLVRLDVKPETQIEAKVEAKPKNSLESKSQVDVVRYSGDSLLDKSSESLFVESFNSASGNAVKDTKNEAAISDRFMASKKTTQSAPLSQQAQLQSRDDSLPAFKYQDTAEKISVDNSSGPVAIVLTEEDIAKMSEATTEFDAAKLPSFDASMPIIDSGIARLQLEEWFKRLAKAPLVHPSVIAAQFGEQEAFSAIDEAQAGNYPQVSLGLSTDSQTSVRNGEKVASVQGLDASNAIRINPNVSITQLLFDGGATESRVNAAKSRSIAATSRRESTEVGIALRAADTLIELAKLQEQLEAARDNLDEVSRLRDMIRERVNIGRDSPSEMLQMNTRVFEAQNQVVRLQGLRAEAGARHEETFGEPPVVLAFPDVFAPIPMSVESGIDMATRFNPDIVNARTLVDVALAEHQAAKRDALPRIEAEARVNAYDATRTGADFYDTFMGVTVSHSLFDGGRQDAVETRSAKGIERTRAQSQQTLADVEFAIKRAYANRGSIIPRYKSLQAQLDQKLKTRQAYETQFIAGRRPLNDLITAQQQVLDAALTVVETKAELHRQHFTILALIGDLIDKK